MAPTLGHQGSQGGLPCAVVRGSHAQQAQQAQHSHAGCQALLASKPSMLVRAAAGLVPWPALLGSKQWPSHAAASCGELARLAC